MLTIGRIFAGDGWRYLWDQVAGDPGDYYLVDVGRGESPGQWGGRAAGPELGLAGLVGEEQLRSLFGGLAHPVTGASLGRPPRQFRGVNERLAASRAVHDKAETAQWAQRELDLLEAGASSERVDAELRVFRSRADERWASTEATIRRGGERRAVAGFDLTFSAPKSLSVLWAAAPPEQRAKIWAAHHEGVTAAMGFIEREAALSRCGYDGVRQVDSTGLVTASFDHRTSRAGDVHVHTHTATLNRVRCADGEWRALDGRAVYRAAAAAGAIYDRVRETALERDLGIQHEIDPNSGAREIVGVEPEVRRLFSARQTQIEGRLDELVAEWRAQHGTDPSEWTVTKMSEWARLDTAARKGPGEATTDALRRWDTQCRAELGTSLADVWASATHPNRPHASAQPAETDDQLIAVAVRAVDRAKSTWTRYDLVRELTRRLPIDPTQATEETLTRVDRLVATALEPGNNCGVVSLAAPPAFTVPASLRRPSDNGSLYSEHGATRYTTDTALATERRLLAYAHDTTGPRLDPAAADAASSALDVDRDQAAAVAAVLGSGRRLDALVGPAGTGKTSIMGSVAQAWTQAGRQVLGVSIAENATRVLAGHAGIRAVNAAKLIFEHTQRSAKQRRQRWWDDAYAIAPGALVILDEAGMASRHTIDHVAAICAAADAKLLLVGDPDQLPSPDAGGTFELIAAHTAAATLTTVRRFQYHWERAASLRLRAGDASVIAEYDLRGRITGGTLSEVEDAAFSAAMADRARGLSVYLLADTNDIAARLARRARDVLVAVGRVDDTRTVALADGNHVGAGDQIVTRDNDRHNRSGDGRFVANRDHWTVRAVTPLGGLRVVRDGSDHTVDLDPAYVAGWVQLAYASTVHAAQGGTHDTAHTVLSPRSTRTSAYVGLTRGRVENHAYLVCTRPEGVDLDGPPDDPLAVLAGILQRPDPPDATAALNIQAEEADRAVSLATLFPIWQDLLAQAGARHAQTTLSAIVGNDLAEATVASAAWPALSARLRRLERTGIDPAAALAAAAGRPFDDAEDLAAVLHWRLRHTETTTTDPTITFTQLSPTGPGDLPHTARGVAAAMDARTHVLAHQIEDNPPTWAAALGERPTDPDQHGAWAARAGIVAGYREAFGITTPDDPIGPPPAPTHPDAHAWWTRAAAALTHTEKGALNSLPTEALEAIIERAHTHQATAPPPVADQLRCTATALRHAHTQEGAHAHIESPNGHSHTPTGLYHAPTACPAGHDTARLARQLERLERAQAVRNQWNLESARLDTHAAAAQAVLDHRQTTQQAQPYTEVDTATLIRRLAAARHRGERAATTADRYQQQTELTTIAIDGLLADIERAATVRPAYAEARDVVLGEQQAAARILTIRADLDNTRLGRHTVRRQHRANLEAELEQLQREHPALGSGDLTKRWDSLLANGETADQQALATLNGRHHQTTTDLDWYRNTGTQLRADAHKQTRIVAGIRAELSARTTETHKPRPAGRRPHQQTPKPQPSTTAVAQELLTNTTEPPQAAP